MSTFLLLVIALAATGTLGAHTDDRDHLFRRKATTYSDGSRPPIPKDRDQAADGYDPSRRVTAVMSVWRALVKGERPSR
jgi:hypothetical protein